MDFDKIKETGLQYAEKGKNAAMDLTEKARTEIRVLNDQAKLAKAQRELGALVYSLAKNGETNQPLVDKYIDAIRSIEQEIEQLKAVAEPAEETAAPEQPAAPTVRVCPQCGAVVPEDALFCSKCGAQL